MAEITDITVSRTVRVNTGNYEGTECFVSLTAKLDPLDDYDEEVARLQQRVDKATLLQLGAVYKSRGKAVTVSTVSKTHGIPLPPKD